MAARPTEQPPSGATTTWTADGSGRGRRIIDLSAVESAAPLHAMAWNPASIGRPLTAHPAITMGGMSRL